MKKEIKKKKGLIDKKVTILLRCLLLFLICWFIIYFAVDILDWKTFKIENTKIESIKKILRLTFVFVTICFSIWLINLKNKNSSENQKGTKNE